MTYTFTASSPGTRAYYSGTQGDLQIEMGLYGAIIVLPASVPSACTSGTHASNLTAEGHWGESDFRLAAAAYDHPESCYDREYLFQFSEMDPRIHTQALAQVTAKGGCVAGAPGCSLEVTTEPYHPAYFMINGRSMPDDMDPNYSFQYPHQPYNGDPTCRGELVRAHHQSAGNILSTSMAIMCASWAAMETSLPRHRYQHGYQSCRAPAFTRPQPGRATMDFYCKS